MKRKGTKLISLVIVTLLLSIPMLAGCGSPASTEGDTVKALPTVGISTGSSGTTWLNIMIDALDEIGTEYKDAGKIADYKIVNNVNNGDATAKANIIRDFIAPGVN